METAKAAVAYCRVSTLEQKNGFGIEIQERDVQVFANRRGLCIRRFYKDEGESGVVENRRALRRLFRQCRAGRVGTLVIPSLDRLSRDVRLAENFFYEFGRLGVNILIADMPAYNSKDRKDVLMRQIREAIAEENRKDIIERLWKGRRERVRQGFMPGGNLAYGYRRNGEAAEVDESEATVVRLIFAKAGQGHSPSTIAGFLTGRGLRRRNGKPWTRRQVSAIFSQKALYQSGAVRYGDVEGQNPSLIVVDV